MRIPSFDSGILMRKYVVANRYETLRGSGAQLLQPRGISLVTSYPRASILQSSLEIKRLKSQRGRRTTPTFF